MTVFTPNSYKYSVNSILSFAGLSDEIIDIILNGETEDIETLKTLQSCAYRMYVEMKRRFKMSHPEKDTID